MADLHEQVYNFLSIKDHAAVLVLFIGVVNHWVTLVVHRHQIKQFSPSDQDKVLKGKKFSTLCYWLDSANLVHMDKPDYNLPDVVMERVREKIRLGLKATE